MDKQPQGVRAEYTAWCPRQCLDQSLPAESSQFSGPGEAQICPQKKPVIIIPGRYIEEKTLASRSQVRDADEHTLVLDRE